MSERKIISARYWNANGRGISLVAAVNTGCDWAAYIAADDGESEEDCIKLAVETGSKLSAKDAKYFFPDIEESYRR